MAVTESFHYIETVHFSNWMWFVGRGFVGPLITAVLAIYFYPIPAKYAYEYSREQRKKLKEIRQRIEDETPITIEESRQIKRDSWQLGFEFDKQLAQKDEENERLKAQVLALQSQIAELQDDAKPTSKKKKAKRTRTYSGTTAVPDEVEADQAAVLKYISQNEGWVKDSEFFDQTAHDRIKAEYLLESLDSMDYVDRDYNTEVGDFTALSTKGKKYAIDQGFVK